MTDDFTGRARALVGTRFRPQGRSAALGLDCVGLVLAAYGIDAGAVRRNYRLRGDYRGEIEERLAAFFRRVGERRPGDLLIMNPAPDQLHLGVWTGSGLVHAHAGIGRIVETPGEPAWRVFGIYRRRRRKTKA